MLDWLINLVFPPRATELAAQVDKLYVFLLLVAGFFSLLIFAIVAVFAIKYRRSRRPRAEQVESSFALELIWSGLPLLLCVVIFLWGAHVFWQIFNVPPEAQGSEIFVVGKQWMWKLHHPEGPREINKLHVPVGRPVKLVMTSEDVIHSFYIPAFRIKQDVLPGRYVQMWFEPSQLGTFRIYCAEYCGTNHSTMIGEIVVKEPGQYQEWLRGDETTPSMAVAGEQLYTQLGCRNCHSGQSGASGPPLLGRFNKPVALQGEAHPGIMDEVYIRQSILDPGVKITAGYPNLMPIYRGQISEEGIMQIIEYMKTGRPGDAPATQVTTQPTQP